MQQLIDLINREGRKRPEMRISEDDVVCFALRRCATILGHDLNHVSCIGECYSELFRCS